ncbi:MAG: ATP synthase F1 subunit delta [Bradymonadales bacterium]|nr:MAG: ATP synthase F1 subunit delta [Bradymonadales bacterium]
MRREREAASRYAKALFELCQSSSDAEGSDAASVLEELKLFQSCFRSDPQIRKFFLSPIVSKEDKLEALKSLEAVVEKSYRFFCLLVQADRFSVLDDIVDIFQQLVEEEAGELSVELRLARSIEEPTKNRIRDFLEKQWKRSLRIQIKEVPSLVGGFVAVARGRSFDGSVQTQLNRLKQSIAKPAV